MRKSAPGEFLPGRFPITERYSSMLPRSLVKVIFRSERALVYLSREAPCQDSVPLSGSVLFSMKMSLTSLNDEEMKR